MMPNAIVPGRPITWYWPLGPLAGFHQGIFLGWGAGGFLEVQQGTTIFGVHPFALVFEPQR